MRLVQFVSDLVYADAVAADCVAFHQLFRRWGFEAPIYAHGIDSHHQGIAQSYQSYKAEERDLLIFHYSSWTPVAEFLLEKGCRLVLVYHNVTPAGYFQGLDAGAEFRARKGRENLTRFAPVTRLALGVSEYNRRELEEAGFRETATLPFMVDFSRLEGEPNHSLLSSLRDGYVNLLSVGRVVPNKRHDDMIKVLYYYQRGVSRQVRLFLVGAHDAQGPYCRWLGELARYLGVERDVHFTGQVNHADLLAYLHGAHVYLSMSEHEGFGVPLIESMYLGVPVIAYSAAAVPYTMGEAGSLLKRKEPAVVAELVHLLVDDAELRRRMVARGRERARDFAPERVEAILAGYLERVLEEVA